MTTAEPDATVDQIVELLRSTLEESLRQERELGRASQSRTPTAKSS